MVTTPLSETDPAADLVLKRWKDSDHQIAHERKNHWMNVSFFKGRQWVSWDEKNRTVQNTFSPSVYENERMRVTINKIQPRVDTLMGRFCQRDLSFEGRPTATDDATVTKSKTAEKVIESMRSNNDWEAVKEETVFSALMGGTSAICWEWNGSADEQLWIDDQSGKVVGKGQVQLTSLSIAEFSVETGVRRWQDARWWVSCVGMPPELVKATYGLSWKPDADATAGDGPLRHQVSNMGTDVRPDLTAVYIMYEKPNPACKAGRHVIVVNDTTVTDEPWPFESKDLNLYVFRCLKATDKWVGETMVTQARAPQILYNIARSSQAEHMKLASAVKLMIPKGALDDDTEMTDEPGEPVEYWPGEAGAKPEYLQAGDPGRVIQQAPEELEAELDDILHSHAVSRGESPGDRNSGLALSILAEKNDTPLGPMARDQARGWGLVGTSALRLCSEKADEPRTAIAVRGSGVPDRMDWKGSDIGDQYHVEVPLENVMPTSKAATQALMVQFAQAFPAVAGSLPPAAIIKAFDMPGLSVLDAISDSDVARATYENEQMSTGQTEMPEKWHDHAKHIAEHNQFRNSTGWDFFDDQTKTIFEAHIEAHQRLVEEEAAGQAQLNAVRPGLGGLPQANEPIGSAVPAPSGEMPAPAAAAA